MKTNKEKIIEKYKEYCKKFNIDFKIDDKVNPYNNTTFFCPAGMQQFKNKFKNKHYTGTIANIQSCIRMNDLNEIGDGSHLLSFDMMGLFSFREMEIQDAIWFWWEFIKSLGIKVDNVTIHPDKKEWSEFYYGDVKVKLDNDCKWTDGEIGGYCTEFFVGDLEIGNIVNPLGNCCDIGFGLDRLAILLGDKPLTKLETLQESAIKIIKSGYIPSNKLQGYVLRKILRQIYILGGDIDSPYFLDEIERQENILKRYKGLKDKNKDKSKAWWMDTHGIDLDLIGENYE